MACKSCRGNIFKQKLGRCRTCMWWNLILLLGSGGGWLISYHNAPKQVETIALLLTWIASGVLMTAHIGAYLYYRCQGINQPTEDKSHLK